MSHIEIECPHCRSALQVKNIYKSIFGYDYGYKWQVTDCTIAPALKPLKERIKIAHDYYARYGTDELLTKYKDLLLASLEEQMYED